MNKRTLLGTILFFLFVGELTVGSTSGLYTPAGIPIFFIMYGLLFWLFEALAIKYRLTYRSLVLLTFGIYAVFITGLLHGELMNYVTTPQDNLVTTMIRVQCSFFPIFAYYLINRQTVRSNKDVPSLRVVFILWAVFIGLLTPTKTFGLIKLIDTIRIAPFHSLAFIILGIWAIVIALRSKPKSSGERKLDFKRLNIVTGALLAISLIPSFNAFMVLLFLMPILGAGILFCTSFGDQLV